jgi:hypothetical protein
VKERRKHETREKVAWKKNRTSKKNLARRPRPLPTMVTDCLIQHPISEHQDASSDGRGKRMRMREGGYGTWHIIQVIGHLLGSQDCPTKQAPLPNNNLNSLPSPEYDIATRADSQPFLILPLHLHLHGSSERSHHACIKPKTLYSMTASKSGAV